MKKNDVRPIEIEFDVFMRRAIKNAVRGFLKKKRKEIVRREEMLDIDELADELVVPVIKTRTNKHGVKAGRYMIYFDRGNVADAVDKLKEDHKIAIALIFFLDMDYEEAGEHMKKNADAFRKCLKRALKSLEDKLKEMEDNDHGEA